MTLAPLRAGGKRALADALARLEYAEAKARPEPALTALLDTAWAEGAGHVLGLTGPPGVGKSTLTAALIAEWRRRGVRVGIIAIDPSSRRTGGALLGDRTRIATDPEDAGVFMRSMAARDRLGGLASLTFPAAVLMRALYDRVIVETVGVGQSETDVAGLADTVCFCIQPGSGDSLQFMKAGIMETPHLCLVTKADMGVPARRAKADVAGALSLASAPADGWTVETRLVSATTGEGVGEAVDAIDRHRDWLSTDDRLAAARAAQARTWLADTVREMHGRRGVAAAAAMLSDAGASAPFTRAAAILSGLAR